MSSSFDTTERFFRPADAARVRRNQRQIQVQRLLVVMRNAAIVAVLVVIGFWIYGRTQSDERFAVRTIEVIGAVHTSRADLDAITSRFVGLNLFKLDISSVQNDLGRLAWVRKIEVEKKLPDTLRIRVVERVPVALTRERVEQTILSVPTGQTGLSVPHLRYVDEEGVAFATLSPRVGDNDLPIISNATGEELVRSVALLRELRAKDPQVYSRVSEVRPIAPRGFALFDRELGAFVYANADDVSAKWRSLYAVVRAEGHQRIEYADLRFSDRIVIKPSGATHAQN